MWGMTEGFCSPSRVFIHCTTKCGEWEHLSSLGKSSTLNPLAAPPPSSTGAPSPDQSRSSTKRLLLGLVAGQGTQERGGEGALDLDILGSTLGATERVWPLLPGSGSSPTK